MAAWKEGLPQFRCKEEAMEYAQSVIGRDRRADAYEVRDTRPVAEVRDSWSLIAEDFDTLYRKNENTPNIVVDLPILFNIINGSVYGKNVCEIGSGTFAVGDRLMRIGNPGRILGLDISPEMTRIARENIRGQYYENKVDLLCAPLEESGIPDASFDVAFSVYSMENVGDLRKGLTELNRILVPNGRSYHMVKTPERNMFYALAGLGEYNPGYTSFYRESWPETREGEGVWARYMDREQWKEEFNRAGFNVSIIDIDLRQNQALASSVQMTHPAIYDQYVSGVKPVSSMIIVAQKK